MIDNCIVQIHKGDSSIWSTPWCSIWKEIHSHINLPVTVPHLPNNISDLWSPDTQNWNSEFISQIFDHHATAEICSTPIVPTDSNDVITWKPSAKGVCTSKEACRLLNSQLQVQCPNRGSRSIGQRSLDILTRVWAHKLLPPNIKTFVWRLVRKAIATGVRAGNLYDRISNNCANCNLPENDSHLFFHCNFARAVWFSSKTPLHSSLLPFEQDGVQEALSTVVTTNTTDADLQRLMTTLWYIWIARNDLRFKKKQWSVL